MKSKLAIGDVWRYPYLWKWQAELGEDGGRMWRDIAGEYARHRTTERG